MADQHSVTILWGASPEPGDKATTYSFPTYSFPTAELLDAFKQGVDEAVGWMSHQEAEPGYMVPEEGKE